MSNRLPQLLAFWQQHKDLQWVLATLIDVEGSSYRKPGAMMLISSLGKYHGLLSGGCLEADIVQQAKKTMDDGLARTVIYDMTDEDDVAWQLGIGCGGKVTILLQLISKDNDYLQLDCLAKNLSSSQESYYIQATANEPSKSRLVLAGQQQLTLGYDAVKRTFTQLLKPNPHVVILGGGVDALPLVNMAKELGWQVTLCDSRSAYARAQYFKNADTIINKPLEQLVHESWFNTVNVVVVMHHNVKLDAKALKLVESSAAQYVGLLGPSHRTENVFAELGRSVESYAKPLANPVGLNLGGDMPETIALSILSEAQAVLAKRNALSFSKLCR